MNIYLKNGHQTLSAFFTAEARRAQRIIIYFLLQADCFSFAFLSKAIEKKSSLCVLRASAVKFYFFLRFGVLVANIFRWNKHWIHNEGPNERLLRARAVPDCCGGTHILKDKRMETGGFQARCCLTSWNKWQSQQIVRSAGLIFLIRTL